MALVDLARVDESRPAAGIPFLESVTTPEPEAEQLFDMIPDCISGVARIVGD